MGGDFQCMRIEPPTGRCARVLVQAGSIRGAAGVRACLAHLDRRRMESSGRRMAAGPSSANSLHPLVSPGRFSAWHSSRQLSPPRSHEAAHSRRALRWDDSLLHPRSAVEARGLECSRLLASARPRIGRGLRGAATNAKAAVRTSRRAAGASSFRSMPSFSLLIKETTRGLRCEFNMVVG